MSKRERISLRLDAEAESLEGHLFSYLKQEQAIASREAVLRALKAFYLPWALESCRSEDELKSLAKTLLEELQFRILQIQQRFLEGGALSLMLVPTALESPSCSMMEARPESKPTLMPSETFPDLIRQLDPNQAGLNDF